MNNKTTRLMIATAALAGLTAQAHAGYITTFTSGMTTQVAGATVVDFNTGTLPAYYVGQGSVTSVSSGQTAAPAGDATPYLSVAYPLQSGTMTATLGTSYNYFGLYWGSMDNYNTLRFYDGADLIATITGSDVIAAGTTLGDQVSAGSNRYVNFTFTDAKYNKIQLSTSEYAFETDNHAFANVRAVPEPGTLMLMGMGLAGFGFTVRRNNKKKS